MKILIKAPLVQNMYICFNIEERIQSFRLGLECADTFRPGAFDHLKQNAMKVKNLFMDYYVLVSYVLRASLAVSNKNLLIR